MTNQTNRRDFPEVRVRGVSEEVANDLNNIARNLGTNISALLKPKLREIRDSYPAELRREPRAF